MDLVRLVFDRLHRAGTPDAARRAAIYGECRTVVSDLHPDPRQREAALLALEKVIRRQEMQALHEERSLEL